jgi:hypothetical protein
MLGELIGEESGTVTSQRVLDSEDLPRMEASFEAQGSYLGVKVVDHGTYTAEMRADGTLYGQGQGVMMGAAGEMATWKASGVGLVGADGSVRYAGSIFFKTSVPAWNELNRCAGAFEYSVDADSNTAAQVWTWKPAS